MDPVLRKPIHSRELAELSGGVLLVFLLWPWIVFSSLALANESARPLPSYDWSDRQATYEAYWDDPRPLLQAAEKALGETNADTDPKRWLQIFCAFGMANDSIHLFPKVDEYLTKARRIAETLNLHELLIDTLILEGTYVESLTPESPPDIVKTFGLDPSVPYEKALELAQQQGLKRDRYLVIRNYMSYLYSQGQSSRILQLLEQSLTEIQSLPKTSPLLRQLVTNSMILAFKIANENARVLSMSKDLVESCQTTVYRSFCAYLFYDYATSLMNRQDPPDAKKAENYLAKAEKLALELGDRSILGNIFLTKSTVLRTQNNRPSALQAARIGAAYSRSIQNFSSLADAMLIEADLLRLDKRYPEALGLLAQLQTEIPDSYALHLSKVNKLTADILEEMGQWQKASKARSNQLLLERKFLAEREKENFSRQTALLGLQLEREKNLNLTHLNEIQQRKLEHAAYERKTQAWATLGVFVIAVSLLLGLLWVARAHREIKKLHRYIEKQVLQRFLPPKIVAEILAGQSQLEQRAQHRLVTILFADLVNFTKSAERLDPDILSEILNHFFAVMSDAVFEHGGVIDKFIGDAIMVVFGAPQELSAAEQAKQASRCARHLLRCLEELNQEWHVKYQLSFAMRVGIHQGPGVVGTFGSARRSDYTVIGHTVNLASRIEGHAQPNQILVSETVAQHLPKHELVFTGYVRLKGIEQEVPIFAVRNTGEPQTLEERSAS